MKYLAIIVILLAFSVVESKKCRALALSGGGDKGAYEAAVYVGLVNSLPVEDVSYDVITGVSAGSLNTLGLAVFDPTDVEGASEFIFGLWASIPEYNAFGNWPGGILQGLFFKKGIFDMTPGRLWVADNLGDRTLKRKASFATVDANGATYKVWDYNATFTQPDDYIETAFASSSIPAVFPHITRGEYELVDGGVIWNIDIASAVRRCKEVVDDEKDIIVDMVLCGNHRVKEVDDLRKYSTMQHLLRGHEIYSFYNGMNDYNSSMALFPDVDFRYLIVPSESLSDSFLPLDFDQKTVDRCFEVGQKDAENAVKLGPGGYAKIAFDYVERLTNGEDVWLHEMIDESLRAKESQPKFEST
mmetsp:Transcript_25061/g.27792  ORF Transcript_25061/g.27792 Transcript_25061/m.27792 type:complete len:358 (-) Transcript_25061:39-1112(-)|eukprot:CAMPEP_0205829688 /NCGR_PEP_ID=MMETSP0206-20130828/38891_1 /ASSEMBLY_ACC=CAM_ASM_000279 /TAXON_ID=36767 /ORGANISM="Euplotes focardii, Strain TN1" /LENGTH=357 /DNA_ID=CAMNT_0053132637 /DNA_START=39 /DNA_END=1112 /DNA_ORIENTATION=+